MAFKHDVHIDPHILVVAWRRCRDRHVLSSMMEASKEKGRKETPAPMFNSDPTMSRRFAAETPSTVPVSVSPAPCLFSYFLRDASRSCSKGS